MGTDDAAAVVAATIIILVALVITYSRLRNRPPKPLGKNSGI